jgi:hypothetical protein
MLKMCNHEGDMMNSLMERQSGILQQTLALRQQLLEVLDDEDLQLRLPGDNPTLGALCRESGEIQFAYIQSFKTFRQDFSYRHTEPGLTESVSRLRAWFRTLDAELKAVLENMSDDEIQTRVINRGGGLAFPVEVQFHVFREGLLIFYGKASVYLRALGKPLPGDWATWIG